MPRFCQTGCGNPLLDRKGKIDYSPERRFCSAKCRGKDEAERLASNRTHAEKKRLARFSRRFPGKTHCPCCKRSFAYIAKQLARGGK